MATPQANYMTMEELAFHLKKQFPQLAKYSNEDLARGVLERRPEYAEFVVDYKPRTFMDKAGEVLGGAVQGVKRVGIAGAELGNQAVNSMTGGAVPYDPAVYKAARGEANAASASPNGEIGREMGMNAAGIALGTAAPEGAVARTAFDAATGAVVGEANSPGGGAIPGAVMGAGGAVLGKLLSRPSMAAGQLDKAAQARLRLLNPGSDTQMIQEAEKAQPFLNSESVITGNPFRNRTKDLLARAAARKGYRSDKLDEAYLEHEVAGDRFNEAPVRQGLKSAQEAQQVPGTQLPPNSKLQIQKGDILDANGNVDHELVSALSLDSAEVGRLMRNEIPYTVANLREGVVHPAAAATEAAMGRENKNLGRVVAQSRAAEAFQTNQSLADIPPGVKPTAIRGVRQALDVGKWRGISPTVATESTKKAEQTSADLIRGEVSTQLPKVAEHNEPYHRLAQIEALLKDKSLKQRSGTAAQKYAAIRGLASLLRTASLGAISLPAASETMSSSPYQVINSQLRTLLARQISSGNLESASRLAAKIGTSLLSDEEESAQSPNTLPRVPQEP